MASDLTDRLTGIRSSLAFKAPCRVVTDANITLSGFQTIGGITLASGDANLRVLVINQTDATENGIYDAKSTAWARAKDFDGNTDFVNGTQIRVTSGSGAGLYYVSSADPMTIGTSAITFASVSGTGTVTSINLTAPAAGLTVSGGPVTASGSITLALADDLAALEALSGTNTIYYRSASNTWSPVTVGPLLSFSAGTLAITDDELTALAGLTSAADALPYFTGSGTADVTTLTSFGRSLIDDANATAGRATLGLVIGTDVQGYDQALADVAGITFAQGDVLYFNGSNLVALAAGTSGYYLKTQGAGADPVWAAVAGGGGGDVSADAIWDAKGDLAVGTGADTAARLAVGTNGQVLMAASGETTGLEWATLVAADVSDFSTAADARIAAAVGVSVQAYDADLASWAGVTRASGFDTFTAMPTSANLASLVSDETGSGALVFGTGPTIAGSTLTGVHDAGGATSFEIPNSATPTVDADGEIAVDTTVTDWSHGILKYFGGEELGVVAMPIAAFTTPTDGYVVAYNATNDEFELVANAGGGGSGDVTAAASLTDNAIVRGDGGSKGVQTSTVLIDDTTGTLYPATTDSGSLGTTTKMWSDLFLASGGVINFNNGAVTLTHSGNSLSVGATSGVVFNGAVYISTIYDALHSGGNTTIGGGFKTTPYNAGTKSSGTFTLDYFNGHIQYAVNGGAHTLSAPTTAYGALLLCYTNNGSAGAITTTSFDVVSGDTLTTTNGDEFLLYITTVYANTGAYTSLLHVVALQ